jgi:Flp pilus assembly protein TadD
LVVVSIAASGCALQRHPTRSNPFVKPGTPLVEIGQAVKLPKAPRGSDHAPVAMRTVSSADVLATVEASDPELSAALVKLAAAETPETHRMVAGVYRELGILDMAYDHFLRASQLDRTDAAAYEGLARVWRDWGFPHLGLADASRATYWAPGSASAHNTLGTVLARLGHSREARHEYERAIQLDPQAAYPLNNLCYLSFLTGDDLRAVNECKAALALDPTLKAAGETLASLERRAAERDR